MTAAMQHNIPLAAHTTLHVGGVADYFAAVTSVQELRQALEFAQQKALPVLILGGGSNVLFPDAGYRGLVIKNAIAGQTTIESGATVAVTVGAGENWDDFVAAMVAQGYWGIENLSAIPGTVGATPIQNVGAYGVEVAHVITQVTAVHSDTFEEKTFDTQACQFGYRDSYFKTPAGKKWVVTTVTFCLQTQAQPQLHYADLQPLQAADDLSAAAVRAAVIAIRADKFPDWSRLGTAGSFFKNPVVVEEVYLTLTQQYPDLPAHQTSTGEWKLSLGWILDKVCGLKGKCQGDVCLYDKQALVLTNAGSSAASIMSFVEFVTQTVFAHTNIRIEPEVLLVQNQTH